MRHALKFSLFVLVAVSLLSCEKDNETPPKKAPVANAGPSQTIQLPPNSGTLTGSGTTENFKITGYLWSLVSGPNVPVITSQSSPTTTVTGIIAGNYIFQLMVIDSAGLTDVDTVSWIVNSALQQTLTLQPANNPNEGHVNSYLNNAGVDTEIPIGAWTITGNTTYWRELLKFDFSQIPANSTIVSANLYLYAMPNPHGGDLVSAHSGTGNACFIERITTSWTSFAGMTWSNQPAITASNRSIIPQSTSAFQNDTIVVKTLIQDMLLYGNYGFGIRLQNESVYNMRQYASSYHTNAALHPKLVITYQPQ